MFDMAESIKEAKKVVYYKLISELQAFLLNNDDISAQVRIYVELLIDDYRSQVGEI